MTPPRRVEPWDVTWMTIAHDVSRRSKDPNTQHGCVVVGPDNVRVSDGFNGPPPGVDDDLLHFGRNEIDGVSKYDVILHAEVNALRLGFQHRGLLGIKDCTLYVTGQPCSKCALHIVASGIRTVVCGPVGSACVDDADARKTAYLFRTWGVSQYQLVGGERVTSCGLYCGK